MREMQKKLRILGIKAKKKILTGILILMNSIYPNQKEQRKQEPLIKKVVKKMILKLTKTLKNLNFLTIRFLMTMKMMTFKLTSL